MSISFLDLPVMIKQPTKNYDIPLDEIPITTATAIVQSNCSFLTHLLYENIPLTPYARVLKKRGRKSKLNPLLYPVLEEGNIISVKMGNMLRPCSDDFSVAYKKRKNTGKQNAFPNSLTIVMFCENKFVNIKISRNGCFHMTGLKSLSHAEACVKLFFKTVSNMNENMEQEKVMQLPYKEDATFIFSCELSNINFNLHFTLSKEKLDHYINKNTRFNSLLETNFGYSGLNIKMPNQDVHKSTYRYLKFQSASKEWMEENWTYDQYLASLDDIKRSKEMNKKPQSTFLIFQSGKVILSSRNKVCMESVYKEFLNIIHEAREMIEEKIKI